MTRRNSNRQTSRRIPSIIGGAVAAVFAMLLLSACSDDKEKVEVPFTVTTSTDIPDWQVDWTSNEAEPDWQEPNLNSYANWSIVLVTIEDELMPYVSQDDRMAIFIGNELRGLSKPVINLGGNDEEDKGTFLLKSWGNEEEGYLNVTLRFYCSKLKQVFTRSAQVLYKPSQDMGFDEQFIPHFTHGSSKYPVVSYLTLNSVSRMVSEAGTLEEGDMVGVFVGDECRGVCTLDTQLLSSDTQLVIYLKQQGERVKLKFFKKATGQTYSFTNYITP